jgi:hypothetical protein
LDLATRPIPFLPSTHGLRYGNRWPSGTALVRLPEPFGITLGDANSGMCGGMALAAADLYRAGRLPAATTTPPAAGTPAFNYLRDRLITSWDIPWGVATFASWSMTPDDSFFGIPGVGRRTLRDQLPKVRAAIDAGGLVLLGLVTVHTFNLGEIGRNHTVLGYRHQTGPGSTSIAVYDPNSPGRDDVGITIDTDAADAPRITHNVGIKLPIRGFFVLPLATADPTPVAAP